LRLQVRRQDQFERKNGGGFDAQELEEHPERYVSNFAHKFAPYASVIINGIYWAPNTPRCHVNLIKAFFL
jgi:alpha-aminoadipic semialdehyde synthase